MRPRAFITLLGGAATRAAHRRREDGPQKDRGRMEPFETAMH
jgi:hypothetical protein